MRCEQIKSPSLRVFPSCASIPSTSPPALEGALVVVGLILLADTLNFAGVELEGVTGDEGGEENDNGADAVLDSVERPSTYCPSRENRQSMSGLPSDPPQTVYNVAVGIKVPVDDAPEHGAQECIQDDVRRIQKGHHSPKGRDVGVLFGYRRSLVDGP